MHTLKDFLYDLQKSHRMEYPRLIESSTYDYMQNILSQCHVTRVNMYLYALNAGVLVLFLGVLFVVLYYSYKNKLTPEEAYEKRIKEQEYILSKIRTYKEHQHHIARSAGITTLPLVDSSI